MNFQSFLRVSLRSLAFALLLAAMLPAATLADEGQPIDPTPTEVSSMDSTAESSDTSAAEGNSADAAFELNLTEQPAVEAADVQVGIFDDSLLPELIAETDLVVVGEGGEPLPLASESAVETLATGDPMWCPVGVTPGNTSCSDPYNALSALIDWLEDNPRNTAGVIWIHKDYDNTTATEVDLSFTDSGVTAFSLNGDDLGSTASYSLTIKGGWKGSGTGIDTALPSVFDGASLEITNWIGDVSLSDIVFTNIVGETSIALQIQTTGKITLTRVEVMNNAGYGVELDNSSGDKDTIVNAGTFSDNAGGDGLNISSHGRVTLTNVSAIHNGGDGTAINNVSLTLKNVLLSGTNIFSENFGDGLEIHTSGLVSASNLVNDANGGYGLWIGANGAGKSVVISGFNEFKYNGGGLYIVSNGVITLSNIIATGNSLSEGADLDNSGAVNANITLTGTNTFSNNYGDGLQAKSNGAITLNKITTDGNGQNGLNGYGAWLDNSGGTAKAVIINGGIFDDNFEGGLWVSSRGTISIAGLSANGNDGIGAELNNVDADPFVPQNITITVAVIANDNEGTGLDIQSLGTISLAKVKANGNQGDGAALVAGKSVSITGVNSFSENQGIGLNVSANGPITLSNITASSNLLLGAQLSNNLDGASGNVTLNGSNEFSGNHSTGLEISSHGSVNVANLKAIGNLAVGGVVIDNAVNGFQGSVSLGTPLLNWCNDMSQNAGTGLQVTSYGSVTLTNICASQNGSLASPGFGAVIENTNLLMPKPVALVGLNSFDENYSGGIEITSSGQISITNISASDNEQGFGANINNAVDVNRLSPVIFTGSNSVSGNKNNGLTVTTYGYIAISNLTASSNGSNGGVGYGAWLDNCLEQDDVCAAVSPQSISLTGSSYFSSNHGGDGLQIYSLGNIKINNVKAVSNTNTGAILKNDFPGATGGVSLSGSRNEFTENANGLQINSRRAITISNLEASLNAGFGAILSNNENPPSPQNVTINGHAIFNENEGGVGLSITSLGSILISNLSVSGNDGVGATLDNAESGANGSVTVLGAQLISGNAGTGLEITSYRSVTLSNLTAESNDGYGVSIDNTLSNQSYDVKVTGVNIFSQNDLTGLDVVTYGGITLSNTIAKQNGYAAEIGSGLGVDLDNQGNVLFAKPIIILGLNSLIGNHAEGLRATSRGFIQASSITATANLGNGVVLDNTLGTNTFGITLIGAGVFEDNVGNGLIVNSNGLISLANLSANQNLGGGVEIDNSGTDFPRNVSIFGVNTFNDNGDIEENTGVGLFVNSQGDISLTNSTANGNGFFGAWLNNQEFAIGNPWIKISGANSFSGNFSTGLFIQAAGNVTLTRITADENKGDGVFVASLKNVTITCASITKNVGTGLYVSADVDLLTLNGIFAYGNSPNRNLFAIDVVENRGCPLS